ncbi:hypothetical protein D3C86_1938830 [compost metagenome]
MQAARQFEYRCPRADHDRIRLPDQRQCLPRNALLFIGINEFLLINGPLDCIRVVQRTSAVRPEQQVFVFE